MGRLRNNLVISLANLTVELDLLRRRRGGLLGWGGGRVNVHGANRPDRRVVFEEGMLCNLLKFQSLLRVGLQQFGYKILCDSREALRPLDTEVKNVFKELSLRAAFERRVTRKQLEEKYAKIPNIKRLVVARLLDHLGSQVLRRTTVGKSLPGLVEEVGPAEVGQLNSTIGIKQNVLRLNVTMNDGWLHRVQVHTRRNHFAKILRGNSLRESSLSLQQTVDLAFGRELKDEVEGLVVFVMVVKLHNVLLVKLVHDLDLQLDLLNQVVLNDLRLVDDFDGVDILGYFVSHLVNFAEAADTDVGVGERLKVITATLALFSPDHRWRQK